MVGQFIYPLQLTLTKVCVPDMILFIVFKFVVILPSNPVNNVLLTVDCVIILLELLINTYVVVEKLFTIKLLLIVVFVVLTCK